MCGIRLSRFLLGPALLLASGSLSASEPEEAFENSFEGLLNVLNELSALELERSMTLEQQKTSIEGLSISLQNATARSNSLETTSRLIAERWLASEQTLNLVRLKLQSSAEVLSQARTKLDEQQNSLSSLRASLQLSRGIMIASAIVGPIIGAGLVLLVWSPWAR